MILWDNALIIPIVLLTIATTIMILIKHLERG